jgi:hypothetical protein
VSNFFGGQFFGGGFFGAVDAAVVAGPQPSGGIPASDQAWRRTKQDIARDRERFGIPDKARLAIEAVAAQQAERLEQDEQKRFEELNRELELRGIEWDARYLESLNYERERLISAEIAMRLRRRLQDEEELMLLVLMAAVA